MTGQHANGAVVDNISGVILAGGRAQRMGGRDKGLLKINGVPMVTLIVQALRPQVATLLINANRNLDDYRHLSDCPTIADSIDGYAGPLAGIASAMEHTNSRLLLTVPCDSPCIAVDYARRMSHALLNNNADICVARDSQRLQPVFALLHTRLLASLHDYLQADGHKIDQWYRQHHMVEVDFSDRPEMFFNINTPDDHLAMQQYLAEGSHDSNARQTARYVGSR